MPNLDKKRTNLLSWLTAEGHDEPKSLTCDNCDDRDCCKLVYDPYNIDGDCLADK